MQTLVGYLSLIRAGLERDGYEGFSRALPAGAGVRVG